MRKYSCRTCLFSLLVVDEADKEPSRYLMYCGALHGSRQTIPISVAACEVLATAYCILWSSLSFGLAGAARSRQPPLRLRTRARYAPYLDPRAVKAVSSQGHIRMVVALEGSKCE